MSVIHNIRLDDFCFGHKTLLRYWIIFSLAAIYFRIWLKHLFYGFNSYELKSTSIDQNNWNHKKYHKYKFWKIYKFRLNLDVDRVCEMMMDFYPYFSQCCKYIWITLVSLVSHCKKVQLPLHWFMAGLDWSNVRIYVWPRPSHESTIRLTEQSVWIIFG